MWETLKASTNHALIRNRIFLIADKRPDARDESDDRKGVTSSQQDRVWYSDNQRIVAKFVASEIEGLKEVDSE